jgi:4-amino-4-deoxy-L-arabinose transferase-like glycosyltransferase
VNNKKQLSAQKNYLPIVVCILVLIFLRLPGIHTSYYQDEYKWPEIVAKNSPLAGTVPHPPLSEKVYVAADRIFGNNNLRVAPFLFSIANALLIFFIVRLLFGTSEALAAVSLFAISFYSVLASLMVDTDGQILPFYFLVATVGYLKWKDTQEKTRKLQWLGLFIVALGLGFLTKLSFIIPTGAFLVDYLFDYRRTLSKKILIRITIGFIAGLMLLYIVLVNAHYFFPSFNFQISFAYWLHFAKLTNRNYFQTLIELTKSILYLSPLLLLPLVLVTKETLRKTRLFFIFIGLGLIFYLVLFDFSGGALDRYFQFLIVLLCIISGPILVQRYKSANRPISFEVFIGTIIFAFCIYAIQFIRHVTPALHPKSEWLGRILHFKWNFLFPFNGGSGPLGFYVSWLFMALIWLFAIALIFGIKYNHKLQKPMLFIFIAIGLLYNGMFIEEYLVGGINGSSRTLLTHSLSYIQQDASIQHVTTYNDIGGFELMQMGKYRKRLYIDPKFNIQDKIASLNKYKEHYLIINIPQIDQDSVYAKYFNSCTVVHAESSRYISAIIYDCSKAPDVSL